MMWRSLKQRLLWLPAWSWFGVGVVALGVRQVVPVFSERHPKYQFYANGSGLRWEMAVFGLDSNDKPYHLDAHDYERPPRLIGLLYQEQEIATLVPVDDQYRGVRRIIDDFSIEPMISHTRYHLMLRSWLAPKDSLSAEQEARYVPDIECLLDKPGTLTILQLPEGELQSLKKLPFAPSAIAETPWARTEFHAVWSTEWRHRADSASIARNVSLFAAPLCLIVGLGIVLWPQRLIVLSRRGRGLCPFCRYDLGFEFGRVCPECGADPKTDG